MDKLIWLPSIDDFGQRSSETLFIPRNTFEKVAGKYTSNVQQFIDRDLKPDVKKHLYMLLHAVGAEEFYGVNSNGDSFPEVALKHEGDDYGYKTFERYAKLYKHHINKDPNRSYGDVLFSDYDDNMHRVLLVVGIDRQKAPDICHKIEVEGLFPDVSMGCKVPWDECSICFHRAPQSTDYCDHAKREMNKIYPDGRKVFVRNWHPKFFDISQVFRGAEAPAKFMHKVACDSNDPHSGHLSRQSFWIGWSPDLDVEIENARQSDSVVPSSVIAEKLGYSSKESQIVKDVPAMSNDTGNALQPVDLMGRGLNRLRASEPRIPNATLAKLAEFPTRSVLGTLTKLGMYLHPDEFQYMTLIKMGMKNEAEDWNKRGIVFDQSSIDEAIEPMRLTFLDVDSDIEKIAQPLMPQRSDLQPHLFNRVTGEIHAMPKVEVKDHRHEHHTNILTPLTALASLYLSYKAGLVKEVSENAHAAIQAIDNMAGTSGAHPASIIPIAALAAALLSGAKSLRTSNTESKVKIAIDQRGGSVADWAMLAGSAMLPYINQMRLQKRVDSGETLGTLDEFAYNYPWVLSALSMAGTAVIKPKVIEKSHQISEYIQQAMKPKADMFGSARPYIHAAATAYPYVQREMTNKKMMRGEEPSVAELVIANNPRKSAIVGNVAAHKIMNLLSEKIGNQGSILTKLSSDCGWSNLLHGVLLNPSVTKVASTVDSTTANAGTTLGLAALGYKEDV